MTASMWRSKSIRPGFLWYDLDNARRTITGYPQPQLGLRNTVQNTGLVWWLPLDLVSATANDKEGDTQTEDGKFKRIAVDRYFGSVETSPPVVIPDPPPVVIPPPVTPPVTPPPVVPPVTSSPKYKIKTITRAKGLPLIVFFGVANNLPGKLLSPGGREQLFTTGSKPEFGPGGTEAGYAVLIGDYVLFIGDDKYVIDMRGEFTKIEFELNAIPPDDSQVVLRSGWMTRARAAELLLKLQALYKDLFRIEL